MLTLVICLLLTAQTFGRKHIHHHRNNAQLSPENETPTHPKDFTGFPGKITDPDWVIPDVKYLHEVDEMNNLQPDKIEHGNTDDSGTVSTTTSTNMATTSSNAIFEDVLKSDETPLKVQGVINAPIIIVQTPHQRRRHQGLKHTNSPKATTSKKQNVLPPAHHQFSNREWDKWDYETLLPDYEILSEDFIIEDTNKKFKPTVDHPTMFPIENSPRRHMYNTNTRQYIKKTPPVLTLPTWYDCYKK